MPASWPDVNEITGTQWNQMTREERQSYHRYWGEQGVIYFVCLTCSYPVEYRGPCDACEENRYGRELPGFGAACPERAGSPEGGKAGSEPCPTGCPHDH